MNTLQSQSVKNLPLIIWQNQPVITNELLASVYETDINNIKQNFSRNAERFIEGQHFFKLSGQDLKEFKHWVTNSHSVESIQIAKNTQSLILWTERGTVRHAKMLGTDKAWDVQEKLEQFYFSQKSAQVKENPNSLTLYQIERLIEQKLNALPKPNQLQDLPNHYDGRKVAVNVNFSLDDLVYILKQNGYRVTRG